MTKIQKSIRSVLFVATLTTALTTYGAGPKSIVINHTNGNSTSICMVDGLSASFAEGYLVLRSDVGELIYPLNEVRGWRYGSEDGEVWGRIDETVPENIIISITPIGILLKGLPSASKITVTSTEGRNIISTTACGEFAIDRATLPTGITILTINGDTYKIGLGK